MTSEIADDTGLQETTHDAMETEMRRLADEGAKASGEMPPDSPGDQGSHMSDTPKMFDEPKMSQHFGKAMPGDGDDDDEKLILDGQEYRLYSHVEPVLWKRIAVLLGRVRADINWLEITSMELEEKYLTAHLEKASDEKTKNRIIPYLRGLHKEIEYIMIDCVDNKAEDVWGTPGYKRALQEIDEERMREEEGMSPETLRKLEEAKEQLIAEAAEVLRAKGDYFVVPYWLDLRRWHHNHPERLADEEGAFVDNPFDPTISYRQELELWHSRHPERLSEEAAGATASSRGNNPEERST